MRSRVRINKVLQKKFHVLPWGFFLEEEDPLGDDGLGSLVEFRFKAPPGTSYSYITIHLIGTTYLRLMCAPSSEFGYFGHEVHKGHVVLALEKKIIVESY
jgi:hypothetical protein